MYKIGDFSKKIGVSIRTLREWDKRGILKPCKITPGGVRFYSEEQLNSYLGTTIRDELEINQIEINQELIDDLVKAIVKVLKKHNKAFKDDKDLQSRN